MKNLMQVRIQNNLLNFYIVMLFSNMAVNILRMTELIVILALILWTRRPLCMIFLVLALL